MQHRDVHNGLVVAYTWCLLMMSFSLLACFCSRSDERYTIGRVRQLFWKQNDILLLEILLSWWRDISLPSVQQAKPILKWKHQDHNVCSSLPGQGSSRHSWTALHSCPFWKGSGGQTFAYSRAQSSMVKSRKLVLGHTSKSTSASLFSPKFALTHHPCSLLYL